VSIGQGAAAIFGAAGIVMDLTGDPAFVAGSPDKSVPASLWNTKTSLEGKNTASSEAAGESALPCPGFGCFASLYANEQLPIGIDRVPAGVSKTTVADFFPIF